MDMFDFQKECKVIPKDYCYKDYSTGEQTFFYCLACNCDMKSDVALMSHINGKKHKAKVRGHIREYPRHPVAIHETF